MNKIILKSSAAILLMGLLLLGSCKKSSTDSAQGNFTWTHKSKSFQATEFAAFTGPTYSFVPFNIMAGFGSFATHFERRISFHLNSFATGPSTIVPYPATVNTFDYIDEAGFNLAGVSGTVNITSNTNNILSGNFSVTLVDASSATSLITGSFTDIPISP